MSNANRFRGAFLCLVALMFAASLQAATSTTGTIYGIVTDSSGAALPGVTVTVTSPNLQGTRTTVSNAKGEYNLELLPPGTYHVQFELQGLDTQTRNAVIVNLNQNTKVDVALGVGKVTESITVTADSTVIDPTQTQTQQNFKQDYLKYAAIGQAGRSYQNVLQAAPGVAGGSNPQVMGSNLGQNNYELDGLNATDPVTHTFATNLVFDAIQEIALQTSGFEAEYGRAVGGIVNVISKSGGNTFSGSLDARLSNQHMEEQGHRHQEFHPTLLANNRSLQDFRTFGPQVTGGGPISKDKLWFFLAAQKTMNETQPPAINGFVPGRRDFNGWQTFGKLTATFTQNQTGSFKYTYNPADIPHVENSSFYRPEAGANQYQSTRIYNASYDAVLSPSWLANLQAGVTRSVLTTGPQSGDLTTRGVIDLITGIDSANYTNFQSSNRDRDQLLGSTTYFFTGAGTHQFKIGLDDDRTKFLAINNATGTPYSSSMCSTTYFQPAGYTCGAYDYVLNGAPYYEYVSTILPAQNYKADSQAYYAQDEWHPVERLTVRAGVRYDGTHYHNDDGSKNISLSKVQPRVGFAYDVFNNASTIVHAHYGQFFDDLGLTLSSYLSSVGAVTDEFAWSNSHQAYVFAGAFGGPAGNLVDPTIKPTYTDEYNLGFTQRLPWNSSLDVTGVYKKTNDIIEDSCAFDNCNTDGTFWLTNNPNGMKNLLRENYQGVITKLEMRPTGWANILASYTWSKSRGSVEYTQNAGADFDIYPYLFVNRYGYLSDDARNRIKLDGYFRLPWNMILGANYYAASGTPYNVTQTEPTEGSVIFLEPRGSRRLPHYSQLDLQLQKNFVFHGTTLGLIGSVFNVMNHETVTGRNGSVGGTYSGDGLTGLGVPATPSNKAFNTATSWQLPRRYEVGFRIEF